MEAEMQEVQLVGCSSLAPQLSWGAPCPSCAPDPASAAGAGASSEAAHPAAPGRAGDRPRGADPAATIRLSGSAGGHPTPPFRGASEPRTLTGGAGGGAVSRGAQPGPAAGGGPASLPIAKAAPGAGLRL